MKPLWISPMVDFAFKLMLGSPEHTRVTVHFLNSMLGKTLTIRDVTIRNPYCGKNYSDDKWAILDILAIDDRNRRLNIEMQTTIPVGLLKRLTYYGSRMLVDQLKEGATYQSLKPSIVICVLNGRLTSDNSELHRDFQMRDPEGKLLTDDLQIHVLQLTNLTVTRENLSTATPVERWAYFFKNAGSMSPDELRALFPEPEFVEATGVLEVINQTPEQRDEYISRLKYQLDETARLDCTREEAFKEGENKGILIGEQRGELKGREEGRQEGALIGRIETLQELLGIVEPTRGELSGCEMTQLTELAERLRLQLRSRGE